MSIILGFGVTEKDFEKQEHNFVRQFLIDNAEPTDKYGYADFDNVVEKLKKALELRSKEYRKLVDEYKEAKDHPDRYSSYYFNIINDIIDLCVIFNFSHYNRQHALSPDGWALMCNTSIFHAHYDEFQEFLKSKGVAQKNKEDK